MSKTKAQPKKVEVQKGVMYKGYNMNWLRKEVDHHDFYLVAEFDKLSRKEVSE